MLIGRGGSNMKPNKEHVSKRLKLLKENLGMSLSDIANKVGSTKSKIDSYIRGVVLPPEDIVDKIATLADVKKEWIYYGDRQEYIRDYLYSLGYGKFIEEYPKISDEVYFEYENRLSYNLNIEFPQKEVIKMVFDDIYAPIFNNYINTVCYDYAKEIQKYPLYSDTPEFNSEKYLSRVRELIRREVPPIKYGETEKILEIAEKEFNTRIQLYKDPKKEEDNNSQEFIDYLIEKLETTKGTLEVVYSIAALKNINYDITSKQSDEILLLLQELRPKLIQMKNNQI